MTLDFLPTWPLPANSFALFGLILLVGLLGGRLASATRALPAITGFIVTGFLLGPGGLNWLTEATLRDARIFVDISLGLVVFELGRRLDLDWMRHDVWLLPTGLAESLLGYLAMYFVLTQFGIETLEAAVAATIGIATSPAVVLLVAQEMKAEGPVARRALWLVALNNLVAVFGLTVLLPFIHTKYSTEVIDAIAESTYLLLGSVVLGFVAFYFAALIARLVGKARTPQFVLVVGIIVLAVGAAQTLKLSILLTLITFGVCARNLDTRRALIDIDFGIAGQLFFIILFVLTGATLRLDQFGQVAWLGLVFVGARFIGKSLGVILLGWPSRLSARQGATVSLALTPMAGLAIGMTQTIYDVYPEFGAHLTSIVVSGIAILQLLGPIATRFAFRAAGEGVTANG